MLAHQRLIFWIFGLLDQFKANTNAFNLSEFEFLRMPVVA
jgi:hypothetical protein